jgi:DNA-binding response OmpR family regulator
MNMGEGRHVLRTYINQFRSKLGAAGRARRLILTEPGIGYRFVDTRHPDRIRIECPDLLTRC